jgi:hypothetical protein
VGELIGRVDDTFCTVFWRYIRCGVLCSVTSGLFLDVNITSYCRIDIRCFVMKYIFFYAQCYISLALRV